MNEECANDKTFCTCMYMVKFMGYIPISIAKNLFESAAAVLP